MRGSAAAWERSALVFSDATALVASIAIGGRLTTNTLLILAASLALLASARLYRPRFAPSALDDLPVVAGRLLVAAAVAALFRQLVDGELVAIDRARVVVLAIVLVLLGRSVVYAVARARRRRPTGRRRTVVVGAGDVGSRLVAALRAQPALGLEPIALVDPDPPVAVVEGLEVLRTSALGEAVIAERAEVVLVAFSSLPEHTMVDLVRTCHKLHVEILFVPRFFELHTVEGDTEEVACIPLVRLPRLARRSRRWVLKRAMDVVLASMLLVAVLPALLVAAWLVRRETGAPAVFRQVRVGVDGRPFTLLKLQTYRPSSESESSTRWSIADARRLGPIGRFLRAWSIDELPQLWNVLRGDMSLVGPRPERPHFVAQFSAAYPNYSSRHRVPSGLTGLAQVRGLRGDTSISDRAVYDNAYIERWSLWADVKILLRTFASVLTRRGS